MEISRTGCAGRGSGSGLMFVLTLLLLPAGAQAAPFAYVANLDGASVSVIDLASEAVVTTISIPGGVPTPEPYWISISADGRIVATSLHNDQGVALIDAVNNTLIDLVNQVGDEPEAVAVNSTGTTVYVADEDPSGDSLGDLYVIDVATRTVTDGPIDLSSVCDEPESMLISPDDRFLYITCTGDSVIRVTTSNFALDSIDANTNDAHGLALNCAGTRLYYSDNSDTFEYDTVNESLTGTQYDDCNLYGGAVSPGGTRLYCVEESDELKIYDVATGGAALDTVALGSSNAAAVAVHPDNTRVYVPVSNADAVEVVSAASMTNLAGNIAVGDAPRGIVIRPGCSPVNQAPALAPWALLVLGALLAGGGILRLKHRARRAA